MDRHDDRYAEASYSKAHPLAGLQRVEYLRANSDAGGSNFHPERVVLKYFLMCRSMLKY
ncbi:hypothetical protein CY34DRAFT_803799 [Suillus luteus UH-Slu-Lm8-n1]|uniref:Uncharacterized protein n=1 Tax=Suillus luteus UH-Slu-Lm8-n1 TaxID=930992 RepID=A0A0D0B0B0_9AGAM|nr:hypothetical protein CY34DRAFT_803799 [Suillus luteus UH-Slu-Lm8-n1]